MRARAAFREVRRLLVELPGLRAFFAANALWEGALGAIRTFVVLWVTTGLGLSLPATAGVIGAAGACVLVGAALAGRLAESFGTRRVVRATAVTYGAPMVVPFLFDDPTLLVPMIPVISASAGIMMALPYARRRIPMMPRAGHGLLTGVYSMSRGVGIVLGPLLAAAAIEAQRALGTPLGTVDCTRPSGWSPGCCCSRASRCSGMSVVQSRREGHWCRGGPQTSPWRWRGPGAAPAAADPYTRHLLTPRGRPSGGWAIAPPRRRRRGRRRSWRRSARRTAAGAATRC